LSDEVVNLLNNNLLEFFKILLTKRVCDQLQGEAWVTNWRVMKAHLDLHLVNVIEEGNIDELLTCVANGTLHHERVVSIQNPGGTQQDLGTKSALVLVCGRNQTCRSAFSFCSTSSKRSAKIYSLS
jgi:hypothetical protein